MEMLVLGNKDLLLVPGTLNSGLILECLAVSKLIFNSLEYFVCILGFKGRDR